MIKINLLAILLLFISCSNSSNKSDEHWQVGTNTLNKEKQNNDSLTIHSNEEINVQVSSLKDLDVLVFKESCTVLKESNINTKNKAIFHQYFSTPQLLSFKISSFCRDSIDFSKTFKCLDYLNGKQQVLRFSYSDSVAALNCYTDFCDEFRNTQRKADSFFCLKPGFIIILEGRRVSFVLINDCSERKQFNLIKEYVKANFTISNYLISRCGLNIE